MEEGSLRCDININVADLESGKKTNITELKNLNSFRAAVKAMEYEEKRHISLLERGEDTERETRRWDELKNETIVMREKGEVADYRYAVDSDIAPIKIEEDWIEEIRNNLPELPHHKKERFIKEYDLPEYDAKVLTQSKEIAQFYEETNRYAKDPKQVSNWIMGDVLRRLNDEEMEIEDLKFHPMDLAELIRFIDEGKISNNIGKKVLRDMFETGEKPGDIINKKGLIQISDEDQLEGVIERY